MSIELSASMYSMDEAFEYGLGLQEANGGNGRIRIRPENGLLVVSLVEV